MVAGHFDGESMRPKWLDRALRNREPDISYLLFGPLHPALPGRSTLRRVPPESWFAYAGGS